jgi:hypothetical protein
MNAEEYKDLQKALYAPSSKKPAILQIPAMRFAMVNGKGDPNVSRDFEDAVGALYSLSYTAKFLPKKGVVPEGYFDYRVSALEGLWDMPEGTDFTGFNKADFVWTLMVMQPDFMTEGLFSDIVRQLKKSKPNPALDKLYFKTFEEGLSCQILHIGPYDAEPATFEAMERFTEEQGYRRTEKRHHEIYMNDSRRTSPEKLKTILRFKVEKK